MKDSSDRVVLAIFAVGVAGLLLFVFNSWALFGVAACGLLVLGLALGFGTRGRRSIRRVLILLFCGYVLLLGSMVWADRGGAPWLVLGFPAATAFLVYGIWPMPLMAGLLYALVFRSSVLPEEKLQRFLAEHGRGTPGAPEGH